MPAPLHRLIQSFRSKSTITCSLKTGARPRADVEEGRMVAAILEARRRRQLPSHESEQRSLRPDWSTANMIATELGEDHLQRRPEDGVRRALVDPSPPPERIEGVHTNFVPQRRTRSSDCHQHVYLVVGGTMSCWDHLRVAKSTTSRSSLAGFIEPLKPRTTHHLNRGERCERVL